LPKADQNTLATHTPIDRKLLHNRDQAHKALQYSDYFRVPNVLK